MIAITLLIGIFGPTANGDRFALFQIIDATVASAAIVAALIAANYRRMPWQGLVAGIVEATAHERANEAQRPVVATDAYADST